MDANSENCNIFVNRKPRVRSHPAESTATSQSDKTWISDASAQSVPIKQLPQNGSVETAPSHPEPTMTTNNPYSYSSQKIPVGSIEHVCPTSTVPLVAPTVKRSSVPSAAPTETQDVTRNISFASSRDYNLVTNMHQHCKPPQFPHGCSDLSRSYTTSAASQTYSEQGLALPPSTKTNYPSQFSLNNAIVCSPSSIPFNPRPLRSSFGNFQQQLIHPSHHIQSNQSTFICNDIRRAGQPPPLNPEDIQPSSGLGRSPQQFHSSIPSSLSMPSFSLVKFPRSTPLPVISKSCPASACQSPVHASKPNTNTLGTSPFFPKLFISLMSEMNRKGMDPGQCLAMTHSRNDCQNSAQSSAPSSSSNFPKKHDRCDNARTAQGMAWTTKLDISRSSTEESDKERMVEFDSAAISGTIADNEKAAVDVRKYKTRMCRKWEELGSCPYEHTCVFAHSKEELRSIAENHKVLGSIGYFSNLLLLSMTNGVRPALPPHALYEQVPLFEIPKTSDDFEKLEMLLPAGTKFPFQSPLPSAVRAIENDNDQPRRQSPDQSYYIAADQLSTTACGRQESPNMNERNTSASKKKQQYRRNKKQGGNRECVPSITMIPNLQHCFPSFQQTAAV
jgi:hypothetical protein